MERTLEKLNRWLSKPGNTQAALAAGLGYKTSETIRKWIENQEVPKVVRMRVLEFLKKGKK